jgi:hypothetical protein
VLLALAATSRADGTVALSPPLPPPAEAWRKVQDEDGILVRTAPSAERAPWGSAEGHLDAAPEAVLEHILSFDKLTRAVPNLTEVRVLSRSDGEAVVYFYFDLPWPIANRDYTVRFRWARVAGGGVIVTCEDQNALGPAETGAVRVRLIRAAWAIRPDGAGSFARYLSLTDLGGSLTRGMAARTAWRQPMQNFDGVRKSFLPH